MHTDAIAELRKLIKAPENGPIPDRVIESESEASASLGFAYGMAGKQAEARAILNQLDVAIEASIRFTALLRDCLRGFERQRQGDRVFEQGFRSATSGAGANQDRADV